MDSLLVDLDKVLDDFEAEENSDTLPPGHEVKPSGYEEYLEEHSEKPWKLISEAPYQQVDKSQFGSEKFSDKNTVNIMYDIPYEPAEKFDLSEADFAPSPTAGKKDYMGTNIYDFKKGNENNYQLNSDSGKLEVNKNLQNEYDLSKSEALSSNIVKNDLQNGIFKLPIQAADLSPDEVQSFQINGHATDSSLNLPKQSNVANSKEEPVIQPLTLSSFSSTASDKSGTDVDKVPIQCNTPQTPYENVFVNPFNSQLKNLASNSSEPSHSLKVYGPNSDQPSLTDSETDIHSELKNHVLAQNQSLSNNDSYNTTFSSLPVSVDQPNPARQFHSLPPTLGFQTQGQGLNQNGHIDSHGKEMHDQIPSPLKNSNIETHEQHNVVSHQNDGCESGVQQLVQVCSFNDDVELSEKDLDDYLGDDDDKDVTVETDESFKDLLKAVVFLNGSESIQQHTDTRHFVNSNTDIVNMKKDDDFTNEVREPKSSVEFNNISKMNQTNNFREEELNTCFPENKLLLKQSVEETKQDIISQESILTDDQILQLESKTGANHLMQPQTNASNFDESKTSLKTISSGEAFSSAGDSVGYVEAPVISEKYKYETADVINDSGATAVDVSNMPSGTIADSIDIDVRPKDLQGKVQRPNTLMGLSIVNMNSESPFVLKEEINPEEESQSVNGSVPTHKEADFMTRELVNKEHEGRELMDVDQVKQAAADTAVSTLSDKTEENLEDHGREIAALGEENEELREPRPHSDVRPQSWEASDKDQPQVLKQKRPTSLNLSPRPEFSPQSDRSPVDQSPEETGASGENIPEDSYTEEMSEAVAGAEGPAVPSEHPPFDPGPPPPYTATLGRVAPKWVPDAEAPVCMNCDARFTFTKRRHHCRACGKVFCSQCCSMKNRLVHLENREGRVCFQCHQLLAQAEHWNEALCAGRSPHPNNPNDYCSTVPPTQQAASSLSPPSVLVPVAGVLKRDGVHRRSEPKQVMFSDGIRPGGDLTELDGSAEVTRMPPRRSRVQKKVERHSQDGHHSPRSRRMRTVEDRTSRCLIPEDGLPPLVLSTEPDSGHNMMPNPQPDDFMQQIKDEEASPVIFAITPNLRVLVKIINLDCCVNHIVWCFTTQGMVSVGQEEIVTALEVSPDETTVPRDIFTHLYTLYEEASKGIVVTELGYTIFNQSFLGSRDHGGFLYVRATFQCVQKFILPQPPYLHAILLQKWETPWAKVFPIRLMLRLGAEYRYYPCPLIGVRNRKPVYFEIGHTIMNLLADFRNYQYMLPQISGITVHMEDKVTRINFPRNRYDDLMKVVNNSNEHVMAIGATFSMEADSHLVCIQNDDGNYQTQAINIQNKPRKVTGASFVVFNGALKTSSGMSAKSSIVEDGLMVQITPDSMLALKQAMKDMQSYTISCGTISAPKPDETVNVQWVDDDRNVNMGVKSPIDNMPMDGIDSLHIYTSTDYVGENHIIRWTEVFFIQNDDSGSVKWDPVDLSRLGETLATACCVALTPHLSKLKEAALTKIGLRVTIKPDMVGYEAGSCGERLPDIYMNDLDSELIPVMHRATQQNHVGTVLELIFHVLN